MHNKPEPSWELTATGLTLSLAVPASSPPVENNGNGNDPLFSNDYDDVGPERIHDRSACIYRDSELLKLNIKWMCRLSSLKRQYTGPKAIVPPKVSVRSENGPSGVQRSNSPPVNSICFDLSKS